MSGISRDDAKLILATLARRTNTITTSFEAKAKRLRDSLFEKQRLAWDDPAREKAFLTGRRAGKSNFLARRLFWAAGQVRDPEAVALYLSITREQAKRNIWELCKQINWQYEMEGKVNETDLTIKIPGYPTIKLAGASNRSEIEKHRGIKTVGIYVDESASFPEYIREMHDLVLKPTTLDHNAEIIYSGTPAAHCLGHFYDITTDPSLGWKVWHWTMMDNPTLPTDPAEWLADLKAKKGWSDDNAIYQREYMGRWVRSEDSFVYKYNRDRNAWYRPIPPDETLHTILGIDLGWHDATTFSIVQFGEERTRVFQKECQRHPKLDVTAIANIYRSLAQTYTFDRVVMDTGGLGKTVSEELKRRHGVPVTPAEKQKKYDFIEHFNDDLLHDRIKICMPGCEPWEEEVLLLQWDEDRKREDPNFRNDCPDSFLYAWKESLHWANVPTPKKPIPGTLEAIRARSDKMERQMEEQAMRELDPENPYFSETDEEDWSW